MIVPNVIRILAANFTDMSAICEVSQNGTCRIWTLFIVTIKNIVVSIRKYFLQ